MDFQKHRLVTQDLSLNKIQQEKWKLFIEHNLCSMVEYLYSAKPWICSKFLFEKF